MNSGASCAQASSPDDAGSDAPLFVDLDGTLIRSDSLWESFAAALRQRPLRAVAGVLAIAGGRAALKAHMRRIGPIDPAMLPYRDGFVGWLREQRAGGRKLILATAADRELAVSVARHVGLFDAVLASDGGHNLKGRAKLAAIEAYAQGRSFDYCGNGSEDLPIFAAARRAIVVGAPPRVREAARARSEVDRQFAIDTQRGHPADWWRALRPHQWLKNLLVLVPLFTSFRFDDPQSWLLALGAVVAMCLAASSGYVVNDLLDMQADRRHPRKRSRPFASGALSPAQGFAASGVLFLVALALSLAIAPEVAGLVVAYLAGTVGYSLVLKRLPIFDVAALAGLYTLRIAIGGVAADVAISVWLLSFSVFVFMSLALIKRCGELVSMRDRGEVTSSGRGYSVADLAVLQPLGIACSVAAVLVLALYVRSPDVEYRYASPFLLWGALIALLIWLARLWLDTARGRMHDDPLVYALLEPTGRWLIFAIAVLFVLAAFWVP